MWRQLIGHRDSILEVPAPAARGVGSAAVETGPPQPEYPPGLAGENTETLSTTSTGRARAPACGLAETTRCAGAAKPHPRAAGFPGESGGVRGRFGGLAFVQGLVGSGYVTSM